MSKILKWVNQVSIYRSRSSGHLESFKRSYKGFFTKKSGKNAISHELQKFCRIVQSGKCISTNFAFLEHFAWLCKIFAWSCEISFHFFPLSCSQIPLWSISHDCANFSHVHAKLKNIVFQLFFAISSISFSWFHFNHLQINSKSRSKPISLFLSLCIWIIINFICSLQFDSSLLSPIYPNHILKWLQNFIKLVSNSCKGNNMSIECFRHNYYSKDVKLMRIIIYNMLFLNSNHQLANFT